MARGFMGKMLVVDLSNRFIKEEEFCENLGRQFIGGYGIGARIILSQQKVGVDPLGPDNIFGVISGMLNGTPAISSLRYTVVGKSPLTQGWGDANSGGNLGPRLKFAGYDAVFFKGTSDTPVYLLINNGKAELRDAEHIWGKDTYETEEIIKSELGRSIEIACIGPSGEKMALISSIMHSKGRAAGRSGLGAVMGSKKLKALVVKGNMKVPIVDEDRANELRKKVLHEMIGQASMLKKYGTPSIFIRCAESGDAPTKNWAGTSTIDFPGYVLLSADHIFALQEKKYACYQCPIGCGGYMKEGTGDYIYEAGAKKPEYETIAMFGSNCLNSNLHSIIKVNDICNRYGLDTISTGATIAMTIELFERGIITVADTDGIEMTWGNHRSIVTMTEKLAKREGFGDILADGVKVASERIGKDAGEFAIHIQGQELPAHDPKYGYHWGLAYRLDATPGRHTQGGGQRILGLQMPSYDRDSFSGRGEAYKVGSNFRHILNCTGTCALAYGSLPGTETFLEFMKAISGWDLTIDELIKTGERIANVRHAFNIREGLNPLRFKVPDRAYGKPPPKEGPLAGIEVDEETLDTEFLTEMDWDLKTTKPSKRKLLELSLEDIAKELWP